MARVTNVRKAQMRYPTEPVLGHDGQPLRTPVMRNGRQRTTKAGKPIYRSKTRPIPGADPLPNHKCGRCGTEIKPGMPYKHITPKSGPYGGRTLYRCATCPVWHVWEYSSSLPARLAELSHNFHAGIASVESTEDAETLLSEAAAYARELAEEKRENAASIEAGFGHATSQSEEMESLADDLDTWADEIEGASIPDFPEPEEQDCDACAGTGGTEEECNDCDDDGMTAETGDGEPRRVCPTCEGNGTLPCEDCDGTGRVTPEEPTTDQVDEWRSDTEDQLSIVDESPV